jgi:oligopeptide transport system substrate-binding protein
MFRVVMSTAILGFILIVLCHGRDSTRIRADLVYVDSGQINTLDPHLASSSSDLRLCINLWEGLTGFDPETGHPVPAAAELPPRISNDGLEWTFRLRPDGRWSNGDVVVAEDFVRGWRRALEPGSSGDYAGLVTHTIAGALEYYDWRSAAVSHLATLRTLAHGGDPDPDRLAELPQSIGRDHTPAQWAAQRARYIQLHASERDKKWTGVGIRALDASRLQVRLVRPMEYFLDITRLAVLMPVHESIQRLNLGDESLGGLDDDGLLTYDLQWTKPDYTAPGYDGLITNGPYEATAWQFRRRLRMTANPFHRLADALSCRTIDRLIFEDANTAFWAYEAGDVDWMVVLGVDYVDDLLRQARDGARPDIHVSPGFGTYFYNLNCSVDTLLDGQTNPFVDVRVRRAFSIALDRDALCASVAAKQNPPATAILPAGAIHRYPQVIGPQRDVVTANRLLDNAGFANRTLFPEITILYNTTTEHRRIAEAVAHMWRRDLDVRVALQGKESKTFWEDKAQHRFHVARGGWYGDYDDPTTFLNIFRTDDGNNDSGYTDPQYDTLLGHATQHRDAQARMTALAEAESYLLHEGFPVIPLFQYTNPEAHHDNVTGIYPSPRELYPFHAIEVAK